MSTSTSSSSQVGRLFWVDQPHGPKRFEHDRPMVKVLVTFVGGWSHEKKDLQDYRRALLDAVKRVEDLMQAGHE